ncbi:RicAFT regulatory complex protein RicA family protein [Terrilactibacillus laevilacticus]|uniref:RicAFT regulatory complex protein RicA family protein n=1 Tax=Terrilactibacillus laevilacticus TaxID=1380157 RepID=A0ABW5PPM1_9BACI|nr:YlbF family regulator [Terrilactibacillus laevilacticus]
MTLYSKEDILKKAEAIADKIGKMELVEIYRQAEQKIDKNKKVQDLIAQIKRLQKESVNLQHFQKHEAYKQNEAKIEALNQELNSIPIVQSFRQYQEEVNDLLQFVTSDLSQKVLKTLEQTESPNSFDK